MSSVLAVALLLGVAACDDEPAPFSSADPKPTPGTARIIHLRPNGSVLDTAYWTYDPYVKRWRRDPKSSSPPSGSSAVNLVLTVPAASITSSESPQRAGTITAPAVTAMATESLTVALFAGSTSTASRSAALVIPVDSLTSTSTPLQMTVARVYPQLAPTTGDRILVTGGYGGTGAAAMLASAELFTYATRSFVATGSMRLARGRHASTTLADGRVLVTGGETPQGSSSTLTTTTELYSPATGTFTDGPAMNVPRFNHSAVRLDDGRVLVVGGNGLRSAEVYSPTTSSFTRVGDMSVAHGLGHVAVKLPDGRVLVVGGDATLNIQPTAVADLFDPATNTFTAVSPMSVPRMQHFAVLGPDGKVIVGGGRTTGGDPLATTEIYDPATRAFSAGAALPGTTYDQTAVMVSRVRLN